MDTKNFTTIRSLLGGLAKAMDLIKPLLSQHHEQTAYLSFLVAREMGMSAQDVKNTVYAALLYDVGTVMRGHQMSVEEIAEQSKIVSMVGSLFLTGLEGFEEIGRIIENCQMNNDEIKIILDEDPSKENVMRSASVVHLSDGVSMMLQGHSNVLNQAPLIIEQVKKETGREFYEETAEAFFRVAEMEQVWLDLLYNPTIPQFEDTQGTTVSLERTVKLTKLMSRIIDF